MIPGLGVGVSVAIGLGLLVGAYAYGRADGSKIVEQRYMAAEIERRDTLKEFGIQQGARAAASLTRERENEFKVIRATDTVREVIREPARVVYRNVCADTTGVRSVNELIRIANDRAGNVPASVPNPPGTPGNSNDRAGPDRGTGGDG